MLLEAIDSPIRYRLTGGHEILLTPGEPIDLPDPQARKLLRKAPGKVRAVSPTGPAWYLGDLVQIHGQDGRVEAGEVQGLTRVDGPSVCRAGYWYWVASASGERWVHESLVEQCERD